MTTGFAARVGAAKGMAYALRAALWLGLFAATGARAEEPAVPESEPATPAVEEALASEELAPEPFVAELLEPASSACDDLWLVSTRASRDPCRPPHPERMRYWRCVDRNWVESDLEAFTASATPQAPVVVWVHGNNMPPSSAQASGMLVHRLVTRCHTGPMRFVIWSWPSERWTSSVVDDVRIKAPVSESQGYFVAWLVDRLPVDTNVALIGYSYGARVISAGMHMMAGGVIRGRTLEERVHPERMPPRVLLMAAAQDSNCFARGGAYDLALTQLEELVVMRNRRDMVLRCYPRLEQPGGPPALGQAGLTSPHGDWLFPISRSQVRQINVGPQVGLHHSLEYYLESPEVAARMRYFVRQSMPAPPDAEPHLPQNGR
jgi:hypothetical protein